MKEARDAVDKIDLQLAFIYNERVLSFVEKKKNITQNILQEKEQKDNNSGEEGEGTPRVETRGEA